MKDGYTVKEKLNISQEKFVAELVKGKSQREAYRTAYPISQKWKDSTVDSKACILAKQGKVQERYEELVQKAAKSAIDDAVKIRKEIIETQMAILEANMGDLCRIKRSKDKKRLILEPKDQQTLDRFDMRAIKAYHYDRYGNLIIELCDKQPAINCLREMFDLVDRKEKEEIRIVLQGAEEYAD